MTQQLLSIFRGYRSEFNHHSLTGEEIKIEENFKQFSAGQFVLQLVTLGWLASTGYNFYIISERPHALFEQMNYFARVLMPNFPSSALFYAVIIMGFVATLYRIKWDKSIVVRFLQFLIVCWLDTFQWSFGSSSAVSFILMYALLFSAYIPNAMPTMIAEKKSLNQMIEYYFLGIFITYTFSGLWKVIGLTYKLVLKPDDVHWLSPNGALYNAVVSYRNYDLPVAPVLAFYQYPPIWQISFLLLVFVQVFCWLGAYRPQLRAWVGISLIIFHLVSAVFFKTVFITAPLVLLAICFPYHLFTNNKPGYTFDISRELNHALRYTKTYTNGESDWHLGFCAYREMMYDRHPFWGSLWFVPGARMFYKIIRLRKK